jgi:hypothetical protein
MMGRLNRDQEQFLYCFNLEEVVPEDHMVRAIAAVLDLSWVYTELAPYYSRFGRPSVDPPGSCRHRLQRADLGGATISIRRPATILGDARPCHLENGILSIRTASTCTWLRLTSWQVNFGAVGYVAGIHSSAGDRVGCFQSQVFGVGPQVGYIMPLGTTHQALLNFKA